MTRPFFIIRKHRQILNFCLWNVIRCFYSLSAALGGKIRISTVDGEVEYEVKPGTQTDTKIRLRGKGVPSLRNKNVRGDQYVTLVVQVPTKLSEEAKDALRAFDAACQGKPAPEKEKKKRFMDKLKETFED